MLTVVFLCPQMLPCIHITDLCSVIMKLATDGGDTKYFVAVDAGQQQVRLPSLLGPSATSLAAR